MTAPIRPARRGTLLLFLLAHTTLISVVNLLLFANGAFRPLTTLTGGLITGTLIAGVALLAILVWGVCLRFGRLRPYDIGWLPRQMGAAVIFTAALWSAAQLVHLGAGLIMHGGIVPAPSFSTHGVGGVLGMLAAQLFGNALFEELAYRGFLFPQLYLRIHGSGERPWLRFIITLLISQSLFALVHMPNRLYLGLSPTEIAADLALLTGWGVLFTLLYLHTDNLFLVVGIHALGNAPTTLFATAPGLDGAGGALLIYGLAVLGVFCWPMLTRALRRRPALAEPIGQEAWAAEN